MSTDTAQRHEWLKLHNSAALDYEVTMTTLRALPVGEAVRLADRLYADLHIANEVRRKAATMIQEG